MKERMNGKREKERKMKREDKNTSEIGPVSPSSCVRLIN